MVVRIRLIIERNGPFKKVDCLIKASLVVKGCTLTVEILLPQACFNRIASHI